MGSFFQQGRVRLNIGGPKYEPLEVTDPWIGLDDDEDDELITTNDTNLLPSEITHESNHRTSNGKRMQLDGEEFEELTIDVGNEDETFLYDRRMVEAQGSPLYKTFAAARRGECIKRKLLCTVLAVVVSIIVVCLFYFLLPCPSSSSSLGSTPQNASRNFAINMTGATESSIRLFDVNNDGVQDIIFGYARGTQKLGDEDMQAFCAFINMTVPCAGAVAAVDGTDGTFLWELNVECEVFAILCDHLDANGDGQNDCLIAGRLGVLYAVDSTNGASIWSADPTVTNSSWNYYQPQIVPDLDGDGVLDVVVAHGGNGDYRPSEVDREPNRILLLSGKTGKSLGNYLKTPDQKETYSAVTVYKREDGALYVLFGTGGETVKGSLWTISLWDLYCHVMGYGAGCSQASSVSALHNGDYKKAWGEPLKVTAEGAREILRSGGNKGNMVPTILADLNRDGTQDLIVSLFNGTVAVLNGKDLSVIWTTWDRFDDFETYSTPVPGHFNSDDVPDVMVRLSHGNWTVKYNSTVVFILDGRDGQILWSTQSHSQEAAMTTPLSVRGKNNKDVFVFWTQGRSTEDIEVLHVDDTDSKIPQKDGKNDRRHRRHGDEGPSGKDICSKPTTMYDSELFVMNRDTAQTPLRITIQGAHKYYYNVLEEKAALFHPKAAGGLMRRKRQLPGPPPGPLNITHEVGVGPPADVTDDTKTQPPSHTTTTSLPPKPFPNYTGHPFDDDDNDDEFGHNVGHHDDYTMPDDQHDDEFGHDIGHHDDYTMPEQVVDDNVTRCTLYAAWLRSTGTIGDMDNDGVIDIVYMLSSMAIIKDGGGSYLGAKLHTTLVKTSLLETQDYVTLDPERTFCDASMKRESVMTSRIEDSDLMLGESKWRGYMGTTGNGSSHND